jgi:hypothetical protein
MSRRPDTGWTPAGARAPIAALAGLLLGVVLAAPPAHAQGSNLGPGGYPLPDCGQRPAVPERPESFTDNTQIEAYNQRVEAYNAAMEGFVACLQGYLDDASGDIELIKERMRQAVELSR